ncbi:hypothetical protein [Nonomuraea sp. NPDC001699]
MSDSWPPRTTMDPIVLPQSEVVPDDRAFREAVLAVSVAVADDLRDSEDRDDARRIIQTHVQRWAQGQVGSGKPVSFAMQRQLVEAVIDERFELGALTPYLKDPRVESIDLNGCDQVWITYGDGRCERGPGGRRQRRRPRQDDPDVGAAQELQPTRVLCSQPVAQRGAAAGGRR